MIAFIHKIIVKTVQRRFQKNKGIIPRKKLYEEVKSLEVSISHSISEIFFILIGVISAGFGLKGFLLPNSFIDGGAMGISLLISETTGFSLSMLIIIVNLPFIILGYSNIGKQFAIKSILAIIALALTVHFIPYPLITSDKLLIAVFGGFFLGGGIGMAIRGGAVIDGTEVLAIFVSRKVGATVGDVIIVINIMIFSAAAYLLGVEIALYSMITYIAASKTLDFIIEGIEEYIGVTIVSPHNEEIKRMIIHDIGRGVTIYKGERGFGKTGESQEMDIVYSVITRLDINKLNTEVQKIDPNAFVVMHSVKDIKGGMIKRRPLH